MIGAVNSLRSFFFPEMLSNPTLIPVQGTLNVVMNQNVSLSCHSDSGTPPVRYTLFKHSQKISTLNRPDLTPGLFNLTINSASDVGEYKCKAENNISSGGKYSKSLNFTLKGMSCCIPFSAHFISGRHIRVQCKVSASAGVGVIVCSRYCFGLHCVPAVIAELNFTAKGYYFLRGRQCYSDPAHWALHPWCPSHLPTLPLNSRSCFEACPVLSDAVFSVFFLQSPFPNQCWAHPPLKQRKARMWPCLVSRKMALFLSHTCSSKEDKAFLPQWRCRRGKQLWFFYLLIPLVTLEPINAELKIAFAIIQNTATVSTLH